MKDIKEASDLYLKVMKAKLNQRCEEIKEKTGFDPITSLNEGGFEGVAKNEEEAEAKYPGLMQEFREASLKVIDIQGELHRRGATINEVN